MHSANSQDVVRQLLLEEIARIIAETTATSGILRTSEHVEYLLRAYPAAGYSLDHINEELILSALKFGVPVEMSRPD